ncbi:MAG: GNAT family N-acetyltransferase [Thermoanaerobaculia bacterium]
MKLQRSEMERPSPARNKPSFLLSVGQTLLMKVVTTFYRRMVLVSRELHPPPPMPVVPSSVEIGSVGISHDLSDLNGFRPSLSARSILERFERGDDCFAVRLDGRIVHTAWVAFHRARVEYLSRDIMLERDDTYIFDTYTAPEFRSLHLAQARAAFVANYYSERGFRRSLGLVALENRAGLAVPESLGYQRIGYYSALGVGRWRQTWSKPLLEHEIPPLVRMD